MKKPSYLKPSTKRSAIMRAVKGKHTKPELIVRSIIHQMGFRFSLHKKELPGRPDICLPKYKLAIFVHGCFWHRHFNCKFATMPSSNVEFWSDKFRLNIKRDKEKANSLRRAGWRVFTIWGCECRKPQVLRQKIHRKLQSIKSATS